MKLTNLLGSGLSRLVVFAGFAAALLGAGSAQAAPTMQTCAPMEVMHSSTAGLTYLLTCRVGPWHMQYAGAVPAGDDPVTIHYRLQVAGPDNAALVQNRTVRVPSPAQIGQVLLREAVMLDSGDLALRDCKDLGCTQYRPLTALKEISQQVIKGVPVTATPPVSVVSESRRVQDEQKRAAQELAQLRAELANRNKAVATEREALEKEREQLAARLAADREQADKVISALRNDLATAQNALVAQGKVEAQQDRAAARELAATQKELAAAQADLAERKRMAEQLVRDRDAEFKRATALETENQRLAKEAAAAHATRDAVRSELAEARKLAEKTRERMQQQKEAYEFALGSMAAQHNAQVASLKRAMPNLNLAGVLEELSVPKVVIREEGEGKAPSGFAAMDAKLAEKAEKPKGSSKQAHDKPVRAERADAKQVIKPVKQDIAALRARLIAEGYPLSSNNPSTHEVKAAAKKRLLGAPAKRATASSKVKAGVAVVKPQASLLSDAAAQAKSAPGKATPQAKPGASQPRKTTASVTAGTKAARAKPLATGKARFSIDDVLARQEPTPTIGERLAASPEDLLP